LSQQPINIFVDGSYNQDNKVGVIGFLILNENESFQPDGKQILEVSTVFERNNTRVELRACIAAMEFVLVQSKNQQPEQNHVHLYTDCQTVVNLPARRQRLIRASFLSQRSKRPLHNADLYQEFYFHYDRLLPEIHWVRGHTTSSNRNHVQRQFRHIDKLVRKQLRTHSRET
jgi:ribonuclease HI